MTPHEPDNSEIAEPIQLHAVAPLHPRDALRARIQRERDGMMALAGTATSEIARAEYLEYVDHCEALMRHVDEWSKWHDRKDISHDR